MPGRWKRWTRRPRPGPLRERIGMRWAGLAAWMVVLIAIDMTSRTVGLQGREAGYLIATALASVAVVAIVAFVRLADSPPELRTLRFLAVLLPSGFILCIQVILYFVEVDQAVTEAGEHVFATAILSASAVPFSVYVFRSFARLRDELAQRARHLQSLHATSMSVTSEPSVSRLYDRIPHGVDDVVSADLSVFVLLADQRAGEVLATAPPGREVDPWTIDLVGSVTAMGIPVRACDAGRAFLGVPVRRQGRVIGAMAAVRDVDREFGIEDELLLDMFSVAVSAGIENALRLEEAQLLATVEERERIARELHDDLGQLLGFLTAKIQATQELVTSGREAKALDELSSLERATRDLGAQVREAILGLRARVGSDRPLSPALEDYVAEFGIQADLSTRFTAVPEAGTRLPGPTQYQLLRIAQEALSNARRHAHARSVTVGLNETDGFVELSVADNGDGFDPSEHTSGFGLKTMAERVAALRGTFEVRSDPGAGTLVLVRVPVEGS